MNVFSALLCLFSLTTLCACATGVTHVTQGKEYELESMDRPDKQRFEIVLTSHSDRAICFADSLWPKPTGLFWLGDEFASVETSEGVLPSRPPLLEPYCPGGCSREIRIEPKGILRGFISYEAFGEAGEIQASASRQLSFSVAAYYCAKRWIWRRTRS